MDLYRNCVTELELLVVESKQMGPTIIMGDFNAHLGSLGGLRGNGSPNFQGYLLRQHSVHLVLLTLSRGVTLVPP